MRSLIKLFTVALIVLCNRSQAQDFFPEQTDYAFSLGADYDMPGTNLKAGYKPGINYNLSFLKYGEKFTYNFTAGYRTFDAKEPTMAEADPTTGTITQWTASPYSTFMLYAGAAYNISLTERVRAYGGLNTGFYFSSASVSYKDDFNEVYASNNEKQGYIAPKIGIAFGLSNYLDLEMRAAFNVFTAGVSANTRTGTEGTLYTSISGGLALTFKF